MTTSSPQLFSPHPPSQTDLHRFLTRQLHLLAAERQAEIDQTSLLASNCSPRLLEKRGLAIGGAYLGRRDRLGGYMAENRSAGLWIRAVDCEHVDWTRGKDVSDHLVPSSISRRQADMTAAIFAYSLVELYLPQAHHNSTILPTHQFRRVALPEC